MARVEPFHSKAPKDPKHYHDNDACAVGNAVDPRNRVSGTGGLTKCWQCQRL